MANLELFVQQIISSTATLDWRFALFFFILCGVGEVALSVPYVMEGIWLLLGYQLGSGTLSPLHLIGIFLAGQTGRQLGALMLYQLGRAGTPALVAFSEKIRLGKLVSRLNSNSSGLNRVNLYSPFSVAYGRLLALRIPITLALAVKKKPVVLSVGVLLSSVVWDAVYLSMGALVGTTARISPFQMLVISFVAITAIYVVTFLLKMLGRYLLPKFRMVPYQDR